ncbi:glutaredoxin family protein [Catenibacterium mitsuokai]|uniref:glutaredoxin family protein n=1 Tax=Catenibacterium mitsuokai TaxID=100886 RepID=UPI003F8B2E6C
MKKITMFYLEECPFCQKAKKAMDELMTENKAYQSLDIEKIEESENVALAENYDYYAVPSLFIGKEKYFECTIQDDYDSIKANVKRVFDEALK